MLSSRLLDTTDKCNIIQTSLKDDLYPYTISSDGSSINYSNNSSQTINYNQLSAIGTLATQSYSTINDDNMADCWLPVIVDNDTYVTNKILSDDGSYANANPALSSGRLGIENFLSFTPSFRNFSNAGQMSIDWLLNRHNIPYAVYYGIMCWVRRNGTSNIMTIGGSSAKLETFPKGTRLKHSSRPNDVLIKIDNNTLYLVNSQRYVVGSTSITYNDENSFIIQAGTISSDLYSLADKTTRETWTALSTTTSTENVDGFTVSGLTNNVRLWVPDGDCFFYYESDSEKTIAEVAGVPTNGFISPCLTRYYTNIYRILTLDQSRSFARKNLKTSRCYRKLAHSLSTSPFIGEFAIRALDCKTIKDIVNTYITSSETSRDISQEKTLLKTALKDISLYLQKTITTGNGTSNTGVYVDTKPSPYSLNNNLICNKNQLFNKLITKYGANLLISSGPATLSINSSLFEDNSGVAITQGMDYYCPKNTSNSIVYNNQTIVYDGTTIQTVISSTESKLSIRNTTGGAETVSIPLYDMAKPDINGSSTLFRPKLVYLGFIDRQYMSNGQLYYPANTLANASLIYKYAMKTASVIDSRGVLRPSPTLIKGEEAGPELDAMDLVLNVRDNDGLLLHESYIENQMSFYWEKLSGPEDCEFIENNGGFINTARPSNTTANTRYIQLKIKNSGKYLLQCTINSPFGTFKKQKTIYVYDGADLIEQISSTTAPNTYVANTMLNKWYDENNQTWNTVPTIPANNPEFQPIYLNRDNLRVRCSKFNRVAISQIGGVFVPINTGFTVREFIGMTGPVPSTEVVKLDELYKFSTKRPFTATASANLSITYNLESNTIAKISSIYVEKIRSNTSECEQCYSLYEPKLRAEKTTVFTGSSRVNTVRYNRINKAPEGFLLYKYESRSGPGLISAASIETVNFGYPTITTAISPPVKTYGGYNNNVINSFNIQNNINNTVYTSTIPGLSRPTPNTGDSRSVAAAQPSTLPPVTGFPLDVVNDQSPGKHKLCYQRQLPYVGGGPITFNKGVLHPNSGWIPHTSNDYAIHANRSSVLKFNPGARSTFSFIGPKLSNISSTSANITDNVIEPNTLSSSIELRMSPGVQWNPECDCVSLSPAAQIQLYNDNQKHKEYIDTTINRSSHGYRYLNGGQPKPLERTALTNEATYNDEFGTDQDGDTFSYSFAVTGPASLPSEVDGSDGKKHLRIPTVQDFGIKDIEVKLNFLNYINTKNLVIWLEVQLDGTESRSRNRPDSVGLYSSPIRTTQKFLDQTIPSSVVSGASYQTSTNSSLLHTNIPNNKIANYLDGLLNAQSGVAGGPMRLLLLNQEHIENNGYNLSVKFTDSASKYNVLYDQNIINGTPATSGTFFPPNQLSNIDKQQNIIRNNGAVRPSLAANSYSDRESCELGKVLRNNKLNITAASFSKFNSSTLFRSAAPEDGPCPPERSPKQKQGDLGGATKFTLKIMVLDETDDMSPNDTLINNQYLTGLSSAVKTQTSIDIFNSLCNWELILHVGDVPKFVPHTNPNLASYGNCDVLSLLDYGKNLKYPGYSFIADLTSYQHLLPLANIDAPNTAIADTSLCLTNKNDPIGTGFVVKPVEFPSYAIVQIVASLVPSTTGTLIGTAIGPGIGYSQGFNSIISWFGETRFLSNLEDSGRQIFTQSYTKYPFGSPEKILLNVRKSGSLWYSLEATIMKYHNTPILQLKKHNYVKVQRGVSKYATEFGFDTVGDYTELLDIKNIPEISLSCDGTLPFPAASITYPTTDYGNYIINYGDLVDVTVTGCPPSPSPSNNNGLYITLDTGWVKITNESIENLTKSISFLKYNSALSYGNSLFYNGLHTDMTASKVIICPTRIPYDIFFVGDTVECYSKDDRLLSSGGSIISVNIVKKGLINKNNKLYSVFVLNTAITNQNTISPTSVTNTLLLYSNNTTTDNGIKKDYNAWGLDANGYVKETPPYAGFSAHSVGSYGNMSPFVNKNLLDKNFRYNSLQPAHEILNNHENDKIQKNKIIVYNYNNDSLSEISTFSNDMACGFSYNENDLYDSSIFQTKTSNVVATPENTRQIDGDFADLRDGLFDQIKKTTGYNETSYSFMYIRTSSSSTNSVASTVPLSGYITIENNYEEYVPIKFVDLNTVIPRLDVIDTIKIQTTLEDIVGDPAQTTTVLASSNIKYIEKHLKRLVKDDPSSCHRPGAVITDCPKLRTQTKLNKLYSERTDLIKLLEQQAVQSASATYTDDSGNRQTTTGTIVAESSSSISLNTSGTITKIIKSTIINTDTEYGLSRSFTRKDQLSATHMSKLPPDILPKIEPVITTNSDNSINIQYSGVNLNHYWINIDPKQSCVLDFTSNPKVLDSTEYLCIRANESALNYTGTTVVADNNICPDFARREGVPQFPSDAIGDEGFSSDVSRGYKYMIPFNTIETNKTTYENEYAAITGWTKYTKERFFNINADNSVGAIEGQGSEITVQSKETYWMPLINNAPTNNDGSADTQSVPGIPRCQTDFPSPGGSGLLGPEYLGGGRVNASTRVQNIFNLDDINSIEVQIKRIPRMLRGCDILGTVYRYGNRNIFRQQSSSNPRVPLEVDGIGLNGPLNNGLYCWVCLQQRLTDSSLRYAPLPPFLQHQNEMIFRSFFGSVDRIENRTDLMMSYYPWELIPYEYSRS